MKKALCIALTLCMILALVPAAFAENDVEAVEMFGTKEGNVYTNKALGIRAEFPETWMVLSEEQSQQLMGSGMEALDNEKLAEMLEKNTAVIDLYAIAADNSGDNVNIQLQSLNALQDVLLSEEKIAKINADTLAEQMQGTGIEISATEQTTRSFAGSDHPCLHITLSVQGVPMYMDMVFLKVGTYFATVTSTSLSQERSGAVLDTFKALEEESKAA